MLHAAFVLGCFAAGVRGGREQQVSWCEVRKRGAASLLPIQCEWKARGLSSPPTGLFFCVSLVILMTTLRAGRERTIDLRPACVCAIIQMFQHRRPRSRMSHERTGATDELRSRRQSRIVTEASQLPPGLSALPAPFGNKGGHVFPMAPFNPCVLISLCCSVGNTPCRSGSRTLHLS